MEARAAAAAQRYPQDGLAWKTLGTAQLAQRKDASAALQRAAELLPRDAEVRANLGGLQAAQGELDAAEVSYRAALSIDPALAQAHSNLGDVLASQGRWAEAADHCRQALALQPRLAAAHNNLGRAQAGQRRWVEAEAAYRQALALQPAFAQAHHGLALALRALGQRQAAAGSLREALRLRPSVAAWMQLAELELERQQPEAAAEAYGHALALDPTRVDGWSNRALALAAGGQHEAARVAYQHALVLQPDQADVLSNLGNSCLALGRVDEALAAQRQATALQPTSALLHGNLGHAWLVAGEPALALTALEQAAALAPDELDRLSEVLFTRQYLDLDVAAQQQTRALLRTFGARAAQRATPFTHWPRLAAPGPRLRIGLLSGDLRDHPVAHFLESVLAQWARTPTLEIWAYPTQPRADATTQRLRALCAQWVEAWALDDAALAARVHSDGIDVLIDLSGHTRHNRLPVLAWRPAPLQLSWLGSCASTGLQEIDALVLDPWVAPVGAESAVVEPLLRLPHSFLCFTPPAVALPSRAAGATGALRLGCFNRLAKIGDPVLAVWSRILQALPDSTLALQDRALACSGVRQRLLDRCAAQGIQAGRLKLQAAQPRAEYLAAYGDIDIALDPFPYPGGTTSVEALWMGVPVLTLAGATPLARQGVSLLGNLGLHDWVAADVDDYVAKAVRHAQDRRALAQGRLGLRERLLASPLCDAAAAAGHLRSALQALWQQRRARA